jgi:hypothetical protein
LSYAGSRKKKKNLQKAKRGKYISLADIIFFAVTAVQKKFGKDFLRKT